MVKILSNIRTTEVNTF